MRNFILLGVVFAALCAPIAVALSQHASPTGSCCYPGAACCVPSNDCCEPGAACCFPGSPCCTPDCCASSCCQEAGK